MSSSLTAVSILGTPESGRKKIVQQKLHLLSIRFIQVSKQLQPWNNIICLSLFTDGSKQPLEVCGRLDH